MIFKYLSFYWQVIKTLKKKALMKVSKITTRKNQMKMLLAIREADYIAIACRKVGINESTHYRWLKNDSSYQERYKRNWEIIDKINVRRNARWEMKLNETFNNFTKKL